MAIAAIEAIRGPIGNLRILFGIDPAGWHNNEEEDEIMADYQVEQERPAVAAA